MRRQLLHWLNSALAAVDARACTLAGMRGMPPGPWAVLALGKAALGMAFGARDALGDDMCSALVIGPDEPEVPLPGSWRFCRGAHPVPDARSVAAGDTIERWLTALAPDLPLLVLLSGGGSALAELPVAGMHVPQLQKLNRWLLASGLDIARMNAIRGRFSRLKHGGLLRLAGRRRVRGLCISDVPGDCIADIASGPLSFEAPAWPDVQMPAWLRELHANLPLPERGAVSAGTETRIVARNADACAAVALAATHLGLPCRVRTDLVGDAEAVGRRIVRELRNAAPGVYVYGGETVVQLPGNSGRGGRNQQLALAAALEMDGSESLLLLAAGTDGIDGNTEDAGALVDGNSVVRMREAGIDPRAALESANSNPALAVAGDVIHTGATGTNVGDIVIAWKGA